MLRALVFGMLLVAANCYPLTEEVSQNIEENVSVEDDPNTEYITDYKPVKNKIYVQNFKHIMAYTVKRQHSNLTENEMERITQILEEFCRDFAIDLNEVIENGLDAASTREVVEDGFPDAAFDYVKLCVRNELPDSNDDTIDHIVYLLRRSLNTARQKIDKVIKESQNAATGKS